IPRGSNVVCRVVMSERAGHFFGRAAMDIRLQEIITPSGEVYDGVSAKIVDVGKKKGQKGEVKADGGIQGPVHRARDTFLLLFPPTTLFQLLQTRGPAPRRPPPGGCRGGPPSRSGSGRACCSGSTTGAASFASGIG